MCVYTELPIGADPVSIGGERRRGGVVVVVVLSFSREKERAGDVTEYRIFSIHGCGITRARAHAFICAFTASNYALRYWEDGFTGEREGESRARSKCTWVGECTYGYMGDSFFFILRGWGKRLRSWMISFEVSQGV